MRRALRIFDRFLIAAVVGFLVFMIGWRFPIVY